MATTAYLTKKTVLCVVMETAYNDGTAPAAADAVLADSVEVSIDGEVLERAYQSDQLGRYRSLVGRLIGEISGSVEVKGSGAAYTAAVRPEADRIIRACGVSATIGGGAGTETCTYAPTEALASVAVDVFMDGKRFRFRGCMGTGRFIFEAGKIPRFEFSLRGIWNDDADAAIPAVGAVYDTVIPPVVQSAGFSVGARALLIGGLELDLGNDIAERPSVNATRGLYGVTIVKRAPGGSIDPEPELDATTLTDTAAVAHTLSGLVHDDPTAAFAVAMTIGTTQYNRFALSIPLAVFTGIAPGDREGVRKFDLSFMAAANTTPADADWSILFN